ncbi:MAG: hypothetical protein ACFE9S_01845 [Candidatus Hermodarchaeota archaeon]
MTPSAPARILYRICLTSTLPVHLTFIILTAGVYFNLETPARSAALYPHFKHAKTIRL